MPLNPIVGFAFEKLFGSNENKDLLISLTNAATDPKPPIASVELKNPYCTEDYRLPGGGLPHAAEYQPLAGRRNQCHHAHPASEAICT